MGREELAAALKQKGEAEVKAIRQAAEAEVERYRQQRWQEVERQGQICDREADWSARQECRQVDWRVAKKVRNLRLQALLALDRRLWQQLLDEIARLKPVARKRLFKELAAELPVLEWESVTVHPDDAGHSKKHFPDCRIETDSTVGAGLIVETEDGNIRIDNSLRQRLHKQWQKLCGEALARIEEQAEGEAGR
jgi:vacuolar-type H+-ATPase subunit E/Vma4